MKKNQTARRLLLSLLAAISLSLPAQAETNSQDTFWCRDLYAERHTDKEIIIGTDDTVPHSFYGLKIGDKKSDVLSILGPAFKLTYELKAIGPAYLLHDTVYPDHFLLVYFDSSDRVSLITYQKDQVYHLD